MRGKERLVFVDIDTQRDFLDPTGALYIRGSEAILGNLARLTDHARARGIAVLASACAHTSGDDELKHFPPHCMVGTLGQQRVAATAWPDGQTLGPDDRHHGPLPAHLTLEKRSFDLFSHPDAGRLIEEYNRDRPTFVVYGVATDYCVKAAATGLLDRGCRVAVIVDAIRAIDADGEADILRGFTARGALLTLTEVVCASGSGSPTKTGPVESDKDGVSS